MEATAMDGSIPSTSSSSSYRAGGLEQLGDHISTIGVFCIYLALTIIYLWFGAMKFTEYEANAIQGLVANSPLLSWLYGSFTVRGFSTFLGVLEIAIGLLIAARLVSPLLSLLGGLLSMGLFVVTVSFMFSTPGVAAPQLGFPAISVDVGQFLLKDVCLFAASVVVLGTSLAAVGRSRS
ncbi:MAG: DUF417 family protein [Proteobacteria bacterium]|nr:DUF417 family protein [Pseudomonadota bacterium]